MYIGRAMPESDAYQQWREMVAKAREIEANQSVPLWQKAYKVPGSYQNLALDQLRAKDRNRIINTLQKLNTILAPYQFETFDEYHLMDDKDAERILVLAKRLAPGA